MDETRTNKVMRQIKEICEIAGIRTEEYARVTKRRLDLLGLSRELAREKGALGDRVFELSREESPGSVFEDVTVQAVIARIANLESNLGDLEEEISTIRDSASDRTTDVKRKYQPPKTDPSADSWQASVPPVAAVSGATVMSDGAQEASESGEVAGELESASDSAGLTSVVEVTVEEGSAPPHPPESDGGEVKKKRTKK